MELIVTNNPMVRDHYGEKAYYFEGTLLEVLIKVRDYVHKGYKLVTHPLSGSIKPNQTPYKTVIIKKSNGQIDLESLMIIENAIIKTENLLKDKKPNWDGKVLKDFQLIDFDLISNR